MLNPLLHLRTRLTSPLGHRELDLDVVRGVAILLATGWHFAGAPTDNPVSTALLMPTRTFGWAGVDLFFVLSGFLVGRIIFREHVRTGSFDARRFLVRRAFKLWPIYYIFVAYLLWASRDDLLKVLPNAFHVQNYTLSNPPHLWSLAVEEHFYLAVALLLPLAFRRAVKPSTVLLGAGAIMVLVALGRGLGAAHGAPPVQLQLWTHFRIDALLAGVALAVVSVYYTAAFDRMVRWKALWLTVCVTGIAWLALVPKWTMLGATAGYTVAYIAAAAFMLLLYRAQWVVRYRWLLRPVGSLGIYSYAIYLTHVTTAVYVTRLVEHSAPWINESPLRLVVLYAGVVLAAVALTWLVEWPALRMRDRLFPRRSRALPPASPNAATQPELAAESR